MTYQRQRRLTYLLVSIPALLFLLSQVWLMWTSASTALTGESARYSLEHVRRVLADPLLLRAVWNNIVIPVAGVLLETIAGLGMAIWFTHIRKGRTFWRTVAVIPFALPEIVYLLTTKLLFRPHGYVNSLLVSLGWSAPVGWLQPGSLLMPVMIVLIDAWRVTPLVFLIVLAALDQMPRSYIEAARVDGGSLWQVIRYVQVPLVLPALGVAVLLRAVDAFRIFATPLVLVGVEGLPVLTSLAYHYKVDAHNAAAAQVPALMLGIGLVLSLAVLWAVARRKWGWSWQA